MCKTTKTTKYRLLTTINLIKESIKGFASTFLIFNVPHHCNIFPVAIYDHICTAIDIFVFSDYFRIVAVILNMTIVTNILFICVIEFVRDLWIIKYFEYDDTLPDDNLNMHRNNVVHASLFEGLQDWNDRLFRCYKWILYLYIFNFTFSSIYLIMNIYDYKTVVSLIVFFIIGFEKFYDGYFISQKSKKNSLAYSYIFKKYKSFNLIKSETIL